MCVSPYVVCVCTCIICVYILPGIPSKYPSVRISLCPLHVGASLAVRRHGVGKVGEEEGGVVIYSVEERKWWNGKPMEKKGGGVEEEKTICSCRARFTRVRDKLRTHVLRYDTCVK